MTYFIGSRRYKFNINVRKGVNQYTSLARVYIHTYALPSNCTRHLLWPRSVQKFVKLYIQIIVDCIWDYVAYSRHYSFILAVQKELCFSRLLQFPNKQNYSTIKIPLFPLSLRMVIDHKCHFLFYNIVIIIKWRERKQFDDYVFVFEK